MIRTMPVCVLLLVVSVVDADDDNNIAFALLEAVVDKADAYEKENIARTGFSCDRYIHVYKIIFVNI